MLLSWHLFIKVKIICKVGEGAQFFYPYVNELVNK